MRFIHSRLSRRNVASPRRELIKRAAVEYRRRNYFRENAVVNGAVSENADSRRHVERFRDHSDA